MTGPITRAGIVDLCGCARDVLEASDAQTVVLDLVDIAAPDAVTVDALARLQLTIGRMGKRIRFRHDCREVHELVALMGLADVLPLEAHSRVEPIGEAEHREQSLGVEEERDP